jgi:hypothetical protein
MKTAVRQLAAYAPARHAVLTRWRRDRKRVFIYIYINGRTRLGSTSTKHIRLYISLHRYRDSEYPMVPVSTHEYPRVGG